jgi:hypothetical protein
VKWVKIRDGQYVDVSAMVVIRFTSKYTSPHRAAFWAVCGKDLIGAAAVFEATDEAIVQKLRNLVASAPEWAQVDPHDDVPNFEDCYTNLNNIGIVQFSTGPGESFERAMLVTPVGPIIGSTDRADSTKKVRDWLKGAV